MQQLHFTSRLGCQVPKHQSSPVAAAPRGAVRHAPQVRHTGSRQLVCAASGLDALKSTRPIDRLRYQAKMVFDNFDTDRDGVLRTEELAAYVQYCDDKFGAGKHDLDKLYTPLLTLGEPLPFEEFTDLVRQQVAALSTSRFLDAQLKGAEVGRLLYKCAIPSKDLAAALAVFKLLDFNGDGFLRVEQYRGTAQGIERKIFEDVLEDADSNDDGFLTFEDFLTSYAKERPVFLSMAVMVAHTAAFWLILNSPLDMVFKAVLAALLLLRPAIITNPVIKVWNIVSVLWNSARANVAVAGSSA